MTFSVAAETELSTITPNGLNLVAHARKKMKDEHKNMMAITVVYMLQGRVAERSEERGTAGRHDINSSLPVASA